MGRFQPRLPARAAGPRAAVAAARARQRPGPRRRQCGPAPVAAPPRLVAARRGCGLDQRPLPDLARHARLAGQAPVAPARAARGLGVGQRHPRDPCTLDALPRADPPRAAGLRRVHQRLAAHDLAHAGPRRAGRDDLPVRSRHAAAGPAGEGPVAVLREPRPGADLPSRARAGAVRPGAAAPPGGPPRGGERRLAARVAGTQDARPRHRRGRHLHRPARRRVAGAVLWPRAVVREPARERFGRRVRARGDGPRLRAAAERPAGQPRAGARRRQRPDRHGPGRATRPRTAARTCRRHRRRQPRLGGAARPVPTRRGAPARPPERIPPA